MPQTFPPIDLPTTLDDAEVAARRIEQHRPYTGLVPNDIQRKLAERYYAEAKRRYPLRDDMSDIEARIAGLLQQAAAPEWHRLRMGGAF